MCSEGLAASRNAPNGSHMDRMLIVHVWGMREEQSSKRAREKISNKAPREPMDAPGRYVSNGLKMAFGASPCSYVAGERMFEQMLKLSRHHLVVGQSLIH